MNDKTIEQLLQESGDDYQRWYEYLSNLQLKGDEDANDVR